MEFLVASAVVFSFFVFTILLYLTNKDQINKKERLKAINETRDIEMYVELEHSFKDRFVIPVFRKILSSILRIVPKSKSKAETIENTKKLLRYAGLTLTVEEFSSIKIIFIVAAAIISFIVFILSPLEMTVNLLIMAIIIILGILIPRYFVTYKAKARQQAILHQLPEVMDLLSVSIEAGLAFDAALLRITEIATGPLIYELIQLHREIKMGRPRRLALKNFGECCELPELKLFSSSLIQAEQLGIPIKNVLNTQSNQMRISRRQKAQEKGMKAPVKIMIPMVLFIFPVIFIILLGPTIIQLMDQFMK